MFCYHSITGRRKSPTKIQHVILREQKLKTQGEVLAYSVCLLAGLALELDTFSGHRRNGRTPASGIVPTCGAEVQGMKRSQQKRVFICRWKQTMLKLRNIPFSSKFAQSRLGSTRGGEAKQHHPVYLHAIRDPIPMKPLSIATTKYTTDHHKHEPVVLYTVERKLTQIQDNHAAPIAELLHLPGVFSRFSTPPPPSWVPTHRTSPRRTICSPLR